MDLSDKLYKILIEGDSWKTILGGLRVTVRISGLSLLLGTVLGALVCWLRVRKSAVPRRLARGYIAVLRARRMRSSTIRSGTRPSPSSARSSISPLTSPNGIST